jgi:predicted membrane metal-binding protein
VETNEPIVSHRKVVAGSDRSFGLVFAAVLALIGVGHALFGGTVRWWAIGLSGLFLAAALLAPWILAPLNRAWFKLGLALHYVVNPVVMGLVYYTTLVPMGLILRALGKDLLRRKRDAEATTYWISREPPGPARGSMDKQF